MKQSGFTDEQIIGFIKTAEAGMSVNELTVQATSVKLQFTSSVHALGAWSLQTLPNFETLKSIEHQGLTASG